MITIPVDGGALSTCWFISRSVCFDIQIQDPFTRYIQESGNLKVIWRSMNIFEVDEPKSEIIINSTIWPWIWNDLQISLNDQIDLRFGLRDLKNLHRHFFTVFDWIFSIWLSSSENIYLLWSSLWYFQFFCFLNLWLSKALNRSQKSIVEFHHFLCLYKYDLHWKKSRLPKMYGCVCVCVCACVCACVCVCVCVSCQFFVTR